MAKSTVESRRKLDIYFFQRRGYLVPQPFSPYGTISWSANGQKQAEIGFQVVINDVEQYIRLMYESRSLRTGMTKTMDYRVYLAELPCYLGGVRYYFRCPRCLDRVTTLYSSEADDLACRRCLNLAYESQKEPERYRRWYRRGRLQHSLARLRTRQYTGKPTKRYLKLLEKALASPG